MGFKGPQIINSFPVAHIFRDGPVCHLIIISVAIHMEMIEVRWC